MSAPTSPEEGRGRPWPRLLRIVGVSSLLVAVVAILYLAWCYLIAGSLIYSIRHYEAGEMLSAVMLLSVAVGAGAVLLTLMVVLAILATRER